MMTDEELTELKKHCHATLGTTAFIAKADEKILGLIEEVEMHRSAQIKQAKPGFVKLVPAIETALAPKSEEVPVEVAPAVPVEVKPALSAFATVSAEFSAQKKTAGKSAKAKVDAKVAEEPKDVKEDPPKEEV